MGNRCGDVVHRPLPAKRDHWCSARVRGWAARAAAGARCAGDCPSGTTADGGRRGAFHCEDIETLIRQKDDEYQRPEVYDEVLYQSTKRNAEIIGDFGFGSQAKRDLFALGRRSLNCMINRSSSASAFSSDDIGIIFASALRS